MSDIAPETSSTGADAEASTKASSLGLDSRLGGVLCYVAGWLSGALFMLIERRDARIRFHAFQSFALMGGLMASAILIQNVRYIGGPSRTLLNFTGVLLWLFLMLKAYQGELVRLPIIGEWAASKSGLDD